MPEAITEDQVRQDIVIMCCRLLYGRLLAGQVPQEDSDMVRRQLSDRIREGLCLVVRGCGL